MFLKTPRPSTDQRVRSLLQKAARRGHEKIVDLASVRLEEGGDKTWLRSRAIVITFEECWPLAASLLIGREPSSKRIALFSVAGAVKQKDAAGLGAMAYAYREGDRSMLAVAPEHRALKIVAEALRRPSAFFEWAFTQSRSEAASCVLQSAQKYLAAATWQWDKACILAGALLAVTGDVPAVEVADPTTGEFPYWVALDKHTPQGKAVLAEAAKQVNSTYRRLIWASFYLESACVNSLSPSPWWDAERAWRLRKAGLSLDEAKELWSRARVLVRQRLEAEAAPLRRLVESVTPAGRVQEELP